MGRYIHYQDFSMDDFLKSGNSVEHLARITKTVISILDMN